MSRAVLIIAFLLNYTFSFAQQDHVINDAITTNVTTLLPERILVHSDKNFYISGEIIWFKIYVVEANSYRPQTLSKTAYAELIDQSGNPLLQARIELKQGNGSGSFRLPADAKSGIYQLRLYTNWMKNNPSAIVDKQITIINTQHAFDTSAFILSSNNDSNDSMDIISKNNKTEFIKNLKPAPLRVQVTTNQQSYQRRSPVEIFLQSTIENPSISTNLSVAVYKLNNVNNHFDFLNTEERSKNISKPINDANQYPYMPEMEGYIVRIMVRNAETGKPSDGIPVMLSLTGKLTEVQYGESDEEGLVYFNLKKVYGAQQLFIKTTQQYENVVDLELSKPFLPAASSSIQQKGIIKNEFLDAVEEMHNNLVINKAFSPDTSDKFIPALRDSISFYGPEISTYLLDNYKRFITMEEVLREYVKEVMVRIRNKNYFLLVFSKQLFQLRKYVDYANNMLDENGPLVLIDGIPVSDFNKLMKYDPLKVRKLEVVADRYLLGKKTYDGILSFTTYKGTFEDLQLNNKELLLDDEGWQLQRKFFMPDYNDPAIKNNRIPDFRELLFWAPDIKISKSDGGKISFFTGDITGKFAVVVHGISGDGKVVNEMMTFEVSR